MAARGERPSVATPRFLIHSVAEPLGSALTGGVVGATDSGQEPFEGEAGALAHTGRESGGYSAG